jgi:hypothetical protein
MGHAPHRNIFLRKWENIKLEPVKIGGTHHFKLPKVHADFVVELEIDSCKFLWGSEYLKPEYQDTNQHGVPVTFSFGRNLDKENKELYDGVRFDNPMHAQSVTDTESQSAKDFDHESQVNEGIYLSCTSTVVVLTGTSDPESDNVNWPLNKEERNAAEQLGYTERKWARQKDLAGTEWQNLCKADQDQLVRLGYDQSKWRKHIDGQSHEIVLDTHWIDMKKAGEFVQKLKTICNTAGTYKGGSFMPYDFSKRGTYTGTSFVPYDFSNLNNQTLIVIVDGGKQQPIPLTSNVISAADVVKAINKTGLQGATASSDTSEVITITSASNGTTLSSVDISATTDAAVLALFGGGVVVAGTAQDLIFTVDGCVV